MYLHVKGKRRRAICRECRRLHGAKDCPVVRAKRHENKSLLRVSEQVCVGRWPITVRTLRARQAQDFMYIVDLAKKAVGR
jgi:hypothetical protein